MSINVQHQYDSIRTSLLTKLEESREAFPKNNAKSIHVLATVHENVHDRFKLCLRREKEHHAGERIVLIPYYLENSHWTGFLLEFGVDESIKRAEYIDPMNGSDTVPNELQTQFSEVYPHDVLQAINLPKQNDPIDSVSLTIKNLLTAANVKLPIAINYSKTEASTISLTTDMPTEGNGSKILELRLKLNSGLEKYDLHDVDGLQKEVKETNERIKKFQKQGRIKNAEKEMEFLSELQELQRIQQEISMLTLIAPVDLTDELSNQSSPLVTETISLDEQSKKRSYLEDLCNDSGSMPSCVEKTIMELLIDFEKRLLEGCASSQHENSDNLWLQKLRDEVKREKLLSESIETILNDLERHKINNDYQSIIGCLNGLLKKIRPLNVSEIERLLLKTKKAAELIRDKDIVLLIGETGSGKSTTIQFLASCSMIKTKVEIAPGRFLDHITIDGRIRNPQLKNISSSPFNRSETRYIAPVNIQLTDNLSAHENEILTLCDAPGFGDTGGPEVDIANSLGVIAALEETKSVKLLVLSSYESIGDRGQGIQRLAHILVNMVHEIKDRFGAILYAFTKYPPEKDINALLRDIKKWKVNQDTNLKSDLTFANVLIDMIKKTEHKTFNIDPIHGNPRDLIEELTNITGIKYPKGVFRSFISNETEAHIDNHIRRNRICIDCGMKLKDNNLVLYYLNDLRKLKDFLQRDNIQDVYEECKQSINDTIHQYCSEEIKKMNRAIASQDRLNEDDIRNYEIAIEYIEHIQNLKEHLESSLPSPTQFIQNITMQLEEKKCILEENLPNPLIGIYLDNFYMLKTSFKELEPDYNNNCQKLKKSFDELVQSAHNLISSNDIKRTAEILVKILESVHILQNHLHEHVVKRYNDTIKSFLKHLSTFSIRADSILANISLSNNDIKIITNEIELLKFIKENYVLREHIFKYVEMIKNKVDLSDHISEEYIKDLDEIYDEYIEKIIKYFDEKNQQITILFEKNDDHVLEDIQKLVEYMKMIHTIPALEFKRDRSYYETIDNICNYIQQLRRDAQQLLYTMDHQSENIAYEQIVRSLSRLKNTQWFNNISPRAYETLMSRLSQDLVEYAKHLEGRVIKLQLTWKYPDNVCKVHEIIERMEYLCTLQDNFPELVNYKNKILKYISDCVKAVFNNVKIEFNSSNQIFNQDNQMLEQTNESKRLLNSCSINSETDNTFDVSIKRSEKLKPINFEKCQLNAQLIELNSHVKQHEKILNPGIGGKIKNFFSYTTVETSKQKNITALNYLQTHGYDNIEALKETIKKIEENLRASQNYCESITINSHKEREPISKREKIVMANNMLIYVKHCEKINDHDITKTVNDINKQLKNCLCQYVLSLRQKIKENFARICNQDNHEKDSSNYSQDLEMNLQDLFSLQKFPDIFECSDGNEIIERCQQEFLRYYRMLSDKMEEYKISNKIDQLKDQLVIAQILSCIDRFCVMESSNNGFETLYRQYQVELIKGREAVYEKVIDYIEKRDYTNVDTHLPCIDEKLFDSIAIVHIKHKLQSSLNRLMNDTEYNTNCLDEIIEKKENNREQIKEIKENIDRVRLALEKQNILQLLDEKTKSRLEKFANYIDEILSIILSTSLNSIKAFLDIDSFIEAEQGMDILNRLQRELTDYCTSQDVIKKSQILNERLNNVVSEILSRNHFKDVYDYPINPPVHILTKLKTIASHCGPKYDQAHAQILSSVRENVTLAIESIGTASLAEQMIKIRSLSHVLSFLPDELKNPFQLKIDEIRALINDAEEGYREALEKCFKYPEEDEHTIKKIGELAEQYKKEKLNELFNQLHEQSLRKVQTYRTNVRTYLDKQDVQSAIDAMTNILKYKICLSSFIPEIDEIYQNICVLITRGFRNCCEILTEIPSIEQTGIVEKAFNDILIYLDSTETLNKKLEVLPDSILQYAVEQFQKMFQYFNDNSNKFQTALNEVNIFEIHKVMIISQKWNRFLEKIIECRSKHYLVKNLSEIMKNITLFKDMIFALEKLVDRFNSQLNVELINDDTKKFEIKRNELFTNIMTSIKMLKVIDSKFKDILSSTININELETNLQKKVQRICNQLLDKTSKEELSIKDSDDFRMYYNHLVSFEKHIKLPIINIRQVLERSEENILNKVISLRKQIIATNTSIVDIAQLLIKMKFLAENLSMFDTKINAEIDEALKIYKEKQGMIGIMKLIVELENFDTDISSRLMNEHSYLTGESWRRRRHKMQKQDDLEYILDNLSGDGISKDGLRTRYKVFRTKYDELISNNLKLIDSNANNEPNVEILVSQIKYIVGSITHTSKSNTWDYAFIQEIPELLAYIFAVWTLKNTQHYNTLRGIDAAQSYLLMPHIAQVVAVFRLLGIGYDSHATFGGYSVPLIGKIFNSLVNNLVEIGTGEGKSVVMAIVACVFALTGIDVNCSCYSEVLSNRDKNEFASLFRALGIEPNIKYGTFDRLCEQFLNEQCNIREVVRNMIVTNQNILTKIDITTRIHPKVLLIDEVDVFLSDRFYGGSYNPVVILNDSPVKMLFDSIWQNKTSITSRDVKALPAYKTCATQYSNWVFLFDEAIKDILASLRTFTSSTYIVRNNTIAYVQGESVVHNLFHGYSTMWIYYHEYEKGNITEDSLKTNVGLIVNCGKFSYAEIPHDFAYIAGVTGTLRTLIQAEKDILKNVYAMHKNTFMPSVFGKSNCTYNSSTDVCAVDESQYFIRIRREIDVIRNAKRAILVFFESEEKLMGFYNSSELSSIKEDVQIIMEKVAVKDRELYIKRAASTGKVTLLTRIFGRGTDFVCDHPKLLEHGGVHVLQTFFSQELSEEYQIKGRGARQGDRGSYRMILLDKDLEWVLGPTWKDALLRILAPNLYEIINYARSALYESKCTATKHNIEQCKRDHKASKDFMIALCKGDMGYITSFLSKWNKRE